MKKIILLLGVLLLANTAAMAECDYQCVAPYNMNSKLRTVAGAVTGVNFVSEKVAQSVLKKAISKTLTGDEIKVNLDSYSSKDLKNGIFKSLTLKGKNVKVNDIYLTSLDMKTLCDFNYIKQSDGDVIFMEDFPMSFNITLSPEDINRTMQTQKYQKVIDDLNKVGQSYGFGVKISSTKVAIKSGKFYYVIGISIPFVRQEQKITVESNFTAKKGKIKFANTQLITRGLSMDLQKLDFILNYLNPLDFSVQILDNKDAKVSVDSVDIKNNQIVTSGVVVIPKD